MRRMLVLFLFLVGLGLCVPASAEEPADSETVVMVGNVSYVSGGVGEESRERLNAFSSAFNLRLLLASKSGEFIGDVRVTIADAKGRVVLEAVSEGPIFMANLPPGSYEVTASSGEQPYRQKVAVSKGKQASLHFRWP